ncbi:hypothetical protein A3A41_03650 [Candidatus Kaiserbacteria bacterium RIFCSPLOWO2_01_FULL_54_22]|nr:MAG: hypothetical protein A3A41_03650 [Candidatus Kaiserbacteria bacterium RIFCSPLOWO2_01_FULL_54_22]
MNVGNCKVAWKQSEVKRWVQQWLRNRARAERVLKHLIPKAKNPLRMRFDPSINADHGSDEVGKQFTATREHIRKIEKDALKRRKSPSRQRKLKSFLDD